jgi:hypothetical protein
MEYFDRLENPFLLDAPEREGDCTVEELRALQRQLDEKSDAFAAALSTLHEGAFPETWPSIDRRCLRGLQQKLVDGDDAMPPPTKELLRVGAGGPHCVVTCVPLDAYEGFLSGLRESLTEVGFNGYFYYRQGGFPNPTGEELKYAAVPYSFKIFLMLEAQKLGFDRVLWVDVACRAVNDPRPLFEMLQCREAVFDWYPPNHFQFDSCERSMFPKTRELLSRLVERDVRLDKRAVSVVFGLDLAAPGIKKFVEEYYEMVRLGLPFLSYLPEESVFGAILNRPEHSHVFDRPSGGLFVHEITTSPDMAKFMGFFFLHLHHIGGG